MYIPYISLLISSMDISRKDVTDDEKIRGEGEEEKLFVLQHNSSCFDQYVTLHHIILF